jgi:hypothetical protein
MKKSLFVLLLSFAALFVFNGCRKKAVGFEMDYRGRFEIPVGLEIISSHNFILKNIPSDTVRFFQTYNTTADQIKSIEPRSMSLRAFFQNGSNSFANIKRVEVYIADAATPKSERIIFFRDDIPLNIGERLDLVPNGEDVRRFLLQGTTKFNVRTNLVFHTNTERSIDTEVLISFFAHQ